MSSENRRDAAFPSLLEHDPHLPEIHLPDGRAVRRTRLRAHSANSLLAYPCVAFSPPAQPTCPKLVHQTLSVQHHTPPPSVHPSSSEPHFSRTLTFISRVEICDPIPLSCPMHYLITSRQVLRWRQVPGSPTCVWSLPHPITRLVSQFLHYHCLSQG